MVLLQRIALVITIIGAVVWGIYGLFDFNLVAKMFDSMAWLERAVYIIVGICGLINIGWFFIDIND